MECASSREELQKEFVPCIRDPASYTLEEVMDHLIVHAQSALLLNNELLMHLLHP